MKSIELTYQNARVERSKIHEYSLNLMNEIKNLNDALAMGYDDPHASINLITDYGTVNRIKKIKQEKQALNPRYIIVIGIGGSNLGTLAIQEALLGKQYNLKNPKSMILYAETVDPDRLTDIKNLIEPILKNDEDILLIIISKSGETTETVVNFEILLSILKKYKNDYQDYIVAITDKHSPLWMQAQKHGYSLLEIPPKIGGRFSVFSPVGLFPLAMLDIDIDQLLLGARSMRESCLTSTIEKNPAALSALHIYAHWKKGIRIHDLFLFSCDLESLGKWYRQLMGESIGKEFDNNQNQIFAGITPTVSIGSTDLHSMAQLYLGGPYDKFTTFVRLQKFNNIMVLPVDTETNHIISSIEGKQVQTIMDAILNGVQKAFQKRQRPFMELTLPDKSASTVGQFLQMKMMEIMYLGYLLHLNPFNQPNVEEYKIETKKILETESLK